MKDITKAKAIELLITNRTAFIYKHGEYYDGRYKQLNKMFSR